MKYVFNCFCVISVSFRGILYLSTTPNNHFFDGVIIEGKEYMATKCFGGPPFSIDISGNYDFKDLNVGFIEPDRNEKKRLTKEALTKIREVE